jgi:hypothetical protein
MNPGLTTVCVVNPGKIALPRARRPNDLRSEVARRGRTAQPPYQPMRETDPAPPRRVTAKPP